MIRALLRWDLLRFGIVSVLGLGFDLSTAWGLAEFAGVSLVAAAFLGFMIGAGVNYLLHEIWTFRSATRRLSGRRWLLYLASLAVILLTRITIIALLERLFLTRVGYEFVTLLNATGVSFVVNYILSKNLVFRTGRTRRLLTPDRKAE